MTDRRAANMDVPSFTFLVEGEEVEINRDMISLSIRQEFYKIPVAEIHLLDEIRDDEGTEFRNANLETLNHGKEVEIKIGYMGEEVTVFKGNIVKIKQKAPMHSSPKLIIVMKHASYKLALTRKNRVFSDMTDSDIIDEICSEASIRAEIEDTSIEHERIVQFNASDWDLLNMRAESNSKFVIVHPDEIKVIAPALDQEAVAVLAYGTDILDFEGEIDARQSFRNYNGMTWSQENQEPIEIEESSDQVEAPGGDFTVNDLSDQTTQEEYPVFIHTPVTEDEATAFVKSRITHKNLTKIRARAMCNGNSNVSAGDMVTLEGLGDRFNGDALVSGVMHLFDVSDGWKTHYQLGVDHEQFGYKYDDIVEEKASAVLPAIQGLHIATVVDLEDPMGEHRILLNLPLMKDSREDVWARIASFDAGESRGAFFRPEIGDEVIVGFLNDDPRHPVVLGSLYSSANPPVVDIDNDNNTRGIYTKSELKFEFNDEDKYITMETPDGKKIEMNDADGTILIEDENGNKLLFESGGITLESARDLTIKSSGDINLEGININIKADAQLKAEGAAGAELSSSAIVTLRGSLVNIN